MGAAAVRGVLALWALAVLVSGCVGSARTQADYEEKVANSAEAARSAVETAGLVVDAVAEGKAPGPYASRALSDVESAVGSVATQLGSVQPPGTAGSELRGRMMTLLDECRTVLGELRVTARRGELERLPTIAAPLDGLSARLQRFEKLAPT